jgi:hypothetical protein
MKSARDILRECNYPEEMLEKMSDEDCEAEVEELMYGGH